MVTLASRAAAPTTARALMEALAEHQVIFDNSLVGIVYTRERVIRRCNRRFEDMFGYGVGELKDQNVRILYPSVDDYERIGRQGYNFLETHDSYSDERVMRRKSGDQFWCQVAGRALDHDHPTRDGVWIFQDVTERHRAEEALTRANERLESRVQERTADLRRAYEALREEVVAKQQIQEDLRESQEKYRALFESSPIGISITDEAGRVIEINRKLSRIGSLTAVARFTQDLGLTSLNAALIHRDGTPLKQEELPSHRAIREQRVIEDIELGVRYSNSRTRWFAVTAAPIPVRGYGAMVAYTEITERMRLVERERTQQAELARVSRLNTMGEMAAALAHELGQPLAATLNYLHGCRLRLAADEFDRELFDSAISQAIYHAEQAGGIVRHVRQFVRKHEPESVLIPINSLIEQMVSFLDFERRQSQTSIVLDMAPDLPPVWVDPLEIKQVLINLIKNAFEAMSEVPPPARVIEISTGRKGRAVLVAVSDRGPGVTKTKLTQIFNAFFTTKPKGIGLGLAVCRSIIESHGGRITVDRNVLGGARFSFTLPVREKNA
ncbi:MAG: PAS domain-containing sensor histidine kinase [Panacagrimonas sp.]